jgi:hypothetical protein
VALDDRSVEWWMDDIATGLVIRVVIDASATRKQHHLGIPTDIILRIASDKYDRSRSSSGTLIVTADDIVG